MCSDVQAFFCVGGFVYFRVQVVLMAKHYIEDFFEWGLKDGDIVHIDNVENGLSCKCFCPDCGTELVAYNRLGNKRKNHFQHKSIVNCKNSYETALHYLAKQIISETKSLIVPDIKFNLSSLAQSYSGIEYNHSKQKRKKLLQFDKVEIEKQAEYFRPDLKCFIGDKVLFVEIAVTHFVDKLKLDKIIEHNKPLLEIDLSSFSRDVHREKLTEILQGNIKYMKWIHNPKINDRKNLIERKANVVKDFVSKNLKSHKVYGKGQVIYDCPIHKNHSEKITVEFECHNCEYYLGEYEAIYELGSEPPKYPEVSLDCIGHKANEFKNLLRELDIKNKD